MRNVYNQSSANDVRSKPVIGHWDSCDLVASWEHALHPWAELTLSVSGLIFPGWEQYPLFQQEVALRLPCLMVVWLVSECYDCSNSSRMRLIAYRQPRRLEKSPKASPWATWVVLPPDWNDIKIRRMSWTEASTYLAGHPPTLDMGSAHCLFRKSDPSTRLATGLGLRAEDMHASLPTPHSLAFFFSQSFIILQNDKDLFNEQSRREGTSYSVYLH